MANSFTDWESTCLAHHGIKGQKWGVRRFQNEDGTLTAAGRAHYGMSEGGSRRMSKQYNKQLKKLNRLQQRTDMDLQRQNIGKYDQRASKAMKVGHIAAGVAAATGGGAFGLGKLAKKFDDGIVKAIGDASDARLKASKARHDADSEAWREYKNGNITEKGYRSAQKKNGDAWYDERQKIKENEYNERVANAEKRDRTEIFRDISKYASYAAAGTAAVSYGVAAYNKIQSRLAKKRLTDAGHQKAVAKYKKQYSKMMNKFADTPYSELLKKQQNNAAKSARG